QAQANQFDQIVLSQDIVILEELRRQMRMSQAGRALMDATFVRLALADQFNQIGELLSGDGAPTRAATPVKKKYVEPIAAAPVADVGATFVPPSRPQNAGDTSVAPTEDEEDDALPAVGKVWDNSGPSLSELLKQRQAEPAPEPLATAPPVQS